MPTETVLELLRHPDVQKAYLSRAIPVTMGGGPAIFITTPKPMQLLKAIGLEFKPRPELMKQLNFRPGSNRPQGARIARSLEHMEKGRHLIALIGHGFLYVASQKGPNALGEEEFRNFLASVRGSGLLALPMEGGTKKGLHFLIDRDNVHLVRKKPD